MKAKFLLILITTALSVSSCKENDANTPIDPSTTNPDWCFTVDNNPSYIWPAFLYSKNSKLKRIYQVDSQMVFVQTLSEYTYNNSGKIEKIIYPASDNSYDEYKYDTIGQLSSIARYSNNEITQITSFSYDESGNKIKEEVEDMVKESIFYGLSYTLFKYSNNRFVKTESYQNDSLKFYQLYEYNDSNELIKENLFAPDDDSYVTTEHTYAEGLPVIYDGLLIYSVTYSGNDKEKGFLHDIKRYYDLNGNMTLTIDNMPMLSNSILPDGKQPAFLERRIYEYYEN